MLATLLSNRSVIRLSAQSGEDVAGFLQGLVSQDVTGPLPVWSGLLSPQGKVLFDFIVWAEGADLLIDCEAESAEALVKRLGIYRLRRAITITADPDLAVHWRPEPGNDPRLRVLGTRWLAPADPAAASADAAWLGHRLAHGVTEGQAELGLGETLWLECNAAELSGVSFTKGCYIGQENTARMNWRQKVNRRLLVVSLDQSDPARQRAAYPELGLAVDHLRVEDVDPALLPAWLQLA
ncbi:MAG: folate-binding protein [Novosphingobium sp.]